MNLRETVIIPLGWNVTAPFRAEIETTETDSVMMIRDVNGTPLVGLRLALHRDGPESARGTIDYTVVIPDESPSAIGLEVSGAPWR